MNLTNTSQLLHLALFRRANRVVSAATDAPDHLKSSAEHPRVPGGLILSHRVLWLLIFNLVPGWAVEIFV